MSVNHEKQNQIDSTSSTGCEEHQSGSRHFDSLDVPEKSLLDAAATAPLPQSISSRLKVLFVSEKKPDWVGFALRLDASGCTEPRFSWVSSSGEALTLLRNDSYDCLLMGIDFETKTKQLELLNAIRDSGCYDPIVLVLSMPDDRVVMAGCEFQAEVLISTVMWESPALLGTMERAMKVHQLREENYRLQVENRRRLIRERDESERLLKQQRSMVEELQGLTYPNEPNEIEKTAEDHLPDQEQTLHGVRDASDVISIPVEVQDYYHELLRTYVIMGSGSLKDEILQIAELLAAANLTPGQVLEFHLECVEVIVKGLGNRSSRHVMSRADLLALEIMVHLGECYQKKSVS